MTIEEAIFNRYSIDENKLLKYGFNSDYVYTVDILDNTFKVIVTYADKKITGKIIDLSFDEEYINFRIERSGDFNLKIRSEFEKILLDIRDKTCVRRVYIFDQANRINEFIYKIYSVSPDFPFKSSPYHGVYRNKDNKWFSILMVIPFNKIDKNLKMSGESVVDLMQTFPQLADSLLANSKRASDGSIQFTKAGFEAFKTAAMQEMAADSQVTK